MTARWLTPQRHVPNKSLAEAIARDPALAKQLQAKLSPERFKAISTK